jgi:hypothetical protein
VKQVPSSEHDRTLREVRIRASLLMKAARAGDDGALSRLGAKPKRRAALNVISLEMTGQSYLDFRAQKTTVQPTRPDAVADPARMFERHLAQYLNHWFAAYDQALLHLRVEGGFLFPYKRQFVVVEADLLRSVGLDPDAADWAEIKWNWVKPASSTAFTRLNAKLVEAGFEMSGGSND